MEIGKVIKSLRKKAGYNQLQFAKNCGISASFLSQIESDKRFPHPNTLKNISKVLEIPEQILFFLSLEEESIPEEKRAAFNILFPPVKAFITELFPATKE